MVGALRQNSKKQTFKKRNEEVVEIMQFVPTTDVTRAEFGEPEAWLREAQAQGRRRRGGGGGGGSTIVSSTFDASEEFPDLALSNARSVTVSRHATNRNRHQNRQNLNFNSEQSYPRLQGSNTISEAGPLRNSNNSRGGGRAWNANGHTSSSSSGTFGNVRAVKTNVSNSMRGSRRGGKKKKKKKTKAKKAIDVAKQFGVILQ
eukprot:g998.t1